MTFGREKRLLLGALAMLAPLPLPFNEVVSWPAIIIFSTAVLLFLRRASLDTGGWLPNWALNVLALAYLPVFFLDFTAFWRGRVLQPVVHLLLFALAVKLFALKREKDKWHILVVVFFVFLAATGSSVHPSVVLYIVTFLAGSMLLLSRFVGFEMLSRHVRRAPQVDRIPLRGFITGSVVFAIVASIPLFVLMPRLRSPYVVGPGGGYGSLTQVASFQDSMRLDGIGRIRGSRAVAMRLTYETPPPAGHDTRIKVMTYDLFENDEWARRERRIETGEIRMLSRQADGMYPLGPGEVSSWVGVWMQPFEGRRLGIPVDGVQLDMIPSAIESFVTGSTGGGVLIDDAGIMRLPFSRSSMVRYRVGLGSRSTVAFSSPLIPVDPSLDVDNGGITRPIANFAAQVMGQGGDLDRARRAEQHLAENLEYTTELIGTPAGERIETFLFDTQRGHCELFASSMVLMLRSQGIPSRLATGFLGAEFNPIEGYFIVRQSNAHAWVEAWIEGVGWAVFDPTPPAGRPVASPQGIGQLAAQLYDYLIFRWDRYILTYGLADQVGIASSLRDLWQMVSGWFDSDEETGPVVAPAPAITSPGSEEPAPEQQAEPAPWWPLTLVLLVACGVFFWHQRRRFDAAHAYLRLRSRLQADPGRQLESVPPLEVADRFARSFPHAAEPSRELVQIYLAESFGGRELTAEELQHVRQLLRRALSRRAA